MTIRRLLLGFAVVAVVTTAFATAAWVATPSASRLGERVRLHVTGQPVALGDVAPVLVLALVATEDERFYRHDGVDVVGLARAVPYDVVHASLAQGASTITEQVAKLLYLKGNDRTPWRKLEDVALAIKLDRRYSKTQILAAYLNTAYFGSGAYGVRAASRRYFGVEPRALTLAQASLLAGLPQAPSAYDPIRHTAAARTRQEEVLRSLVRVGAISAVRADAVVAQPLSLRGRVRLPPVTADLEPGPPLAWRDAAAGALLLVFGVVVVALRRRFRGRLLRLASNAFAFVVLLGGAGVLIRSVRTF
jgi:penicillin-binding protein 1A